MIDPLSEEILTFAQAAERLPRLQQDRPVHVSTLWRWAMQGLRGIKLETIKIGGPRVTSAQALQRFIAALSNAAPPAAPIPKARHEEAVDRELDKFGIR